VFGTERMEVSVVDNSGGVVVPQEETDDAEVDTDSNFVRSNMYGLLQQGNDALQYALELAKQSDSPRAFEVVATMMKNLADMNMQMLDAHDKKQKLKGVRKKEEQTGPQKVVNNSIVFQGSTAELNKMLDNMRRENE